MNTNMELLLFDFGKRKCHLRGLHAICFNKFHIPRNKSLKDVFINYWINLELQSLSPI